MKVRKAAWVIAVLLTASAHRIALADKLSDFKDADRYNEGCDTIPNTSSYSSDRSACSTQQSSVNEWCDGGRGPTSCGNESETPNLRKTLVTSRTRRTMRRDGSTRTRSSNWRPTSTVPAKTRVRRTTPSTTAGNKSRPRSTTSINA
jgi:hypothetical protein